MAQLYSQRNIEDSLIRMGAKRGDGTTPGRADILGAIAMVEAAHFNHPGFADNDMVGDLDKVGDPTGFGETYGPSYSVYQIRTIRERKGTWDIRDEERVRSGLDNASQVAIIISLNTRGYENWTTYTSGKYKAYLPHYYPPPEDKYQVVSGDTFEKIDAKLALPRGTMQSLHPTQDPRKLQIGQLLTIPYVWRTVAPGDTLTRIMRTAGWSTYTDSDILRVATFANLADANKIYPGQKLRILKPNMWL